MPDILVKYKSKNSKPSSARSTRADRAEKSEKSETKSKKTTTVGSTQKTRKASKASSSSASSSHKEREKETSRNKAHKETVAHDTNNTRSLEEEAEIVRRFKSLMSSSGSTSEAANQGPISCYDADLGANYTIDSGNRDMSDVKVTIRRKRTLVKSDESEVDVNDHSCPMVLKKAKAENIEEIGPEVINTASALMVTSTKRRGLNSAINKLASKYKAQVADIEAQLFLVPESANSVATEAAGESATDDASSTELLPLSLKDRIAALAANARSMDEAEEKAKQEAEAAKKAKRKAAKAEKNKKAAKLELSAEEISAALALQEQSAANLIAKTGLNGSTEATLESSSAAKAQEATKPKHSRKAATKSKPENKVTSKASKATKAKAESKEQTEPKRSTRKKLAPADDKTHKKIDTTTSQTAATKAKTTTAKALASKTKSSATSESKSKSASPKKLPVRKTSTTNKRTRQSTT